LTYLSRFLAAVGLHSLFLTFTYQPTFAGIWDPHLLLTELYPYIHTKNHICDIVPFKWHLSPLDGIVNMCTPHLDSQTPSCLQIHSKAFGVRFLTSIATASAFRSFCESWPRFHRKQLFISQPTIPLPNNLASMPYQPESAYIPAGWFFLSTALVSILELQDNITLEFVKLHSEYCWMNDLIHVIRGTATEVIDVAISDKIPQLANCLWIHVHPDISDTLIQSFLRNLFSREIENRPLCRPLIFITDSFQLETALVTAWNRIIPIQHDYVHQAEQFSFYKF
jgi:hypothetical protein